MSDETERLDDIGSELEGYEASDNSMNVKELKRAYDKAKKASVGDTISCPFCGKKMEKTTYHKVFCSNRKTSGKNNCKDKFWNFVDDRKRRWLERQR